MSQCFHHLGGEAHVEAEVRVPDRCKQWGQTAENLRKKYCRSPWRDVNICVPREL